MRLLQTAVAVASVAQHVAAWGAVGHRTVAYLAYNYLSSETVDYLNRIIETYPPYDVSDAATWPDTVRYSRPYTEGWHFIDANDSPPQHCSLSYPTDCTDPHGASSCIITAIHNQTSLFVAADTPSLIRKEALRYIIHFLGDIHQPLHVENAYRGGNEIPVCFRHACARNNLHAVWDRDIPHKILGLSSSPSQADQRAAAKHWADSLHNSTPSSADGDPNSECADILDPTTCSVAWAREANAFVCSYVMAPGLDWLKSNDLSLAYFDGAKPIVETQIARSGRRLAAWLNAMVEERRKRQALTSAEDGKQVPLGV